MEVTDTSEPEPEYRTITLHYDGADWTHKVKQPTQAQTTQMIGLTAAKGFNAPGLTKEQAAVLAGRAMKMVQIAVALAAGLHVDPDEWTRLALAMAAGTADDGVMYQVISRTMDAWTDEPELNNRAERRAAKKAARKS